MCDEIWKFESAGFYTRGAVGSELITVSEGEGLLLCVAPAGLHAAHRTAFPTGLDPATSQKVSTSGSVDWLSFFQLSWSF